MASAKTATLSFRIEPGLKGAICTAAQLEHRSIANMVEVMIREYCGRHGVGTEQHDPKINKQTAKTNKTKSPRSKKIT